MHVHALMGMQSAKQLIDQMEFVNQSHALVLSCIAGVYAHLMQFSKALPYFKKALHIRQQVCLCFFWFTFAAFLLYIGIRY